MIVAVIVLGSGNLWAVYDWLSPYIAVWEVLRGIPLGPRGWEGASQKAMHRRSLRGVVARTYRY